MTAEREHEHQDVAAHDREEAEQPLDERRVGVGPRDQLTGRHAVEVVEVQGLQVIVHVVSQVVLDGERNSAAAIAAEVGEPEGRGRERDQQHEPRPERRVVSRITPSTIWRATSGTAVCDRLPSIAAASESRTSLRCRSVYPARRRIQPGFAPASVNVIQMRANHSQRSNNSLKDTRDRPFGSFGPLCEDDAPWMSC